MWESYRSHLWLVTQSNQSRLGKSDGKPNTPLPATKSVGQKQKVGSGNLSLNSPDVVIGDLFHNLYCGSKCVSMDESGIWSILTDTLHYVKPEIDSSVTYSYDQKRHQNSKSRYFDAAFSNVPNEENILVDQTYNSKKKTLMQQIKMGLMYQFSHRHCFLNTRKIDMVILLYSPHQSSNLMKVYVPLIGGQRKINAVSWKVKPMIWKVTICGLNREIFL